MISDSSVFEGAITFCGSRGIGWQVVLQLLCGFFIGASDRLAQGVQSQLCHCGRTATRHVHDQLGLRDSICSLSLPTRREIFSEASSSVASRSDAQNSR